MGPSSSPTSNTLVQVTLPRMVQAHLPLGYYPKPQQCIAQGFTPRSYSKHRLKISLSTRKTRPKETNYFHGAVLQPWFGETEVSFSFNRLTLLKIILRYFYDTLSILYIYTCAYK